jgi:hypothetical protein
MTIKEFDAFTRLDASDVNAYLVNRSFGNAVINGAFDFWQRTTSTSSTGYAADRWASQVVGGSAYTQSRQVLGLGTAQVTSNTPFFYRHQHTAGTGVADYALVAYRIEDVGSFANKTVTLSFWATADAVRNMSIEIVQNFGAGGSAAVTAGIKKIGVSTVVNRYTFTLTLPSITSATQGTSSNIEILFWFDAGSNFNSRTDSLGHQTGSYTFNLWGVQLEEGSVANTFRRHGNSLQGELAACQRYYEKTYALDTPPGTNTTVGFMHWAAGSDGNGNAVLQIKFAVAKRIAPTMSAFTNSGTSGQWGFGRSGSSGTTTVTFDNFSQSGGRSYASVGANYTVCDIQGHWTASAEF